MEDLSEENIRKKCPNCDTSSQTFTYPLSQTKNFHIVCDAHPLEEGHVLIIPKDHLECIANYSPELFEEFSNLYSDVEKFVKSNYRSVATFEHGKFGQTVFHSHIHLMPFTKSPEMVVPEGNQYLRNLDSLKDLYDVYVREGGYLFFSVGDKKWTVDPSLAEPRFFRDRFAKALGRSERGNWKQAHDNSHLMKMFDSECRALQKIWPSEL